MLRVFSPQLHRNKLDLQRGASTPANPACMHIQLSLVNVTIYHFTPKKLAGLKMPLRLDSYRGAWTLLLSLRSRVESHSFSKALGK